VCESKSEHERNICVPAVEKDGSLAFDFIVMNTAVEFDIF
jgi:hypothetical protein